MAPKARPGGSPEAPAGQSADSQVTAEVNIDPGGMNAAGQGAAAPADQTSDQDERPGEDTYDLEDPGTGPRTAGHSVTPARRADGWDADSTAAWNPASAWEQEDAEAFETEAFENGGEPWDEVPDWEGEIVVWEGDRPEIVPTAGVPTSWAGEPTSPPTYYPEYLPSPQSPREGLTGPYAGPRPALPPPPGVYDRKGRHRAKRDNGPWRELVIVTAVAVIVSAMILAVTTAERSNIAGIDSILGSPGTTVPVASPASTLATTGARGGPSGGSAASAALRATSTTAPRNTSSTLSQRASSLPVTAAVAQSLVTSWLATNPGGYGITAGDVAGTVPKQLHYAVQRATGTYWALAAFKPSPALLAQSSTQTGQAELAEFNDSVYAFSWQAGPVWTLLGEFNTGSCPDVWVPRAVLAAWGLCGL
jgi:hypothetical protein